MCLFIQVCPQDVPGRPPLVPRPGPDEVDVDAAEPYSQGERGGMQGSSFQGREEAELLGGGMSQLRIRV